MASKSEVETLPSTHKDHNDHEDLSDSESISSSSVSTSSSSEESDAEGPETTSPPSEPAKTEQASLRDRLKAFMPQLENANDALDETGESIEGGFELGHEDLENEDEGYSSEPEEGPYIELDLGLGVLEEAVKGTDEGDVAFRRPQGDANSENLGKRKAENDVKGLGDDGEETQTKPGGLMGALLKEGAKAKRAKIEVVDDGA